MLHISAHLEKHCNGLLEYRSDVGAMVALWRCGHLKSMHTCELVSHNVVHVDAIDAHWICIEFAMGNSVTEQI